MTRTQKLGLCTWLPDDPVCLAEVNDNFNRLDSSGGRSMQLAESALVSLGGLMAAQAYQGGHAAYAQNITVDAFCDTAQMASYDGVLYRNMRLELMSAGLEGGTVSGGTNSTAGGGAYNASNVQRITKTEQVWTKLFDFYPDAYGSLTKLRLQTFSTSTASKQARIKLAICDTEADEVLWQSELTSISRGSSEDTAVEFTLSSLLDPNPKYAMMLWLEYIPSISFGLTSMVFTVTPIVYSSGSVTMNQTPVPAGAQRAVLLVHTDAEAPALSLRFDGGTYTLLTQEAETADAIPGGESCTLRRYTLDVPDAAETAQLKLALPAAGCKIYDYALILL